MNEAKKVPRTLRSQKKLQTNPKLSGVCGWLCGNAGCSAPHYKIANTSLTNEWTNMKYICGKPLTSDIAHRKLHYDLPENGELFHSSCLCEKHFEVFNNVFEKYFFKFDRVGHTSPESSVSSSPSLKSDPHTSANAKRSSVSFSVSFDSKIKNMLFCLKTMASHYHTILFNENNVRFKKLKNIDSLHNWTNRRWQRRIHCLHQLMLNKMRLNKQLHPTRNEKVIQEAPGQDNRPLLLVALKLM